MHRNVSGRAERAGGPVPQGHPRTAPTTRSCCSGCCSPWWTPALVVYRNYVGRLTRERGGGVLGRLPRGRTAVRAPQGATCRAARRPGRLPPRDARRPTGCTSTPGPASGRARSCWSRPCRCFSSRSSRRRTSSPSPCSRTASGTSTASRLCRRLFVRKALVRAGGEYVRRAVVPFLPERLRLVPAARAA